MAKCFGPDIDGVIYSASSRVPDSFYANGDQHGYFWAKTLALNYTDRFAADNPSRHFDIINVNPTSVVGPLRSATTTKELLVSSNIRGLAIAIGKDIGSVPSGAVYVEDVAKVHIDVLRMSTPRYADFGCGVDVPLDQHEGIIRKHFPDALKDGRFPMGGKCEDRRYLWDTSKTEEFFGWKFQSYETMVKAAATRYLDLLEKERASSVP